MVKPDGFLRNDLDADCLLQQGLEYQALFFLDLMKEIGKRCAVEKDLWKK